MTLTLTPSNGYNQATTLTCTSASAGSTWSISPTSLKPSSAAPVTATVTLQTSTSSADLRSGKRDELLEAALPFGLATGLFLFAAQNSLRKHLPFQILGVAVLSALAGFAGCSGGTKNSTTTPTTAELTITATSGTIFHSATWTVTIQ